MSSASGGRTHLGLAQKDLGFLDSNRNHTDLERKRFEAGPVGALEDQNAQRGGGPFECPGVQMHPGILASNGAAGVYVLETLEAMDFVEEQSNSSRTAYMEDFGNMGGGALPHRLVPVSRAIVGRGIKPHNPSLWFS